MIVNKFISVSKQYYNASLILCKEIIKSAHNPISISGINSNIANHNDLYYDYDLALPLLFSFYHAIELLLKGLLQCKGTNNQLDHKITGLYKSVQEEYEDQIDLTIFSKYIVINERTPEPIKVIFTHLSTSVDQYYEVLRYPEKRSLKEFHQVLIMYKGVKGLSFYQSLQDDIDSMIGLLDNC